jgi:F0F1-type ATP synthase membrane subunit b/b'
MKLIKLIVVLFSLSLFSGCAMQEQKEFDAYKKGIDKQLNSGYIKKSEYYENLYEKTRERENFNTKTQLLNYYNTLINASYNLESKKITSREFNSIKREAETYKSSFEAEAERQKWEAIGELGRQMERMGTPRRYR